MFPHYGIVICQGKREVGGEEKTTMLMVMINTEGQYTIGKVIGSSYQVFSWWKTDEHIRKGFGIENTIAVGYESGVYTLEINGAEMETFKDEEEPIHTGGKNGYVVVIAPEDRFPAYTVDVVFRERR